MDKLQNNLVLDINDNNKKYNFFICIRLDDNDEFYVDNESSIFPDFFDKSFFDLSTMRFKDIMLLRSQIMIRIDIFLNENLQELDQ